MKRIFFLVLVVLLLASLTVSCGDKVTTTPAAATEPPAVTTAPASSAATAVPPASATPTPSAAIPAGGKDYQVAVVMADFFYNMNAVNGYYNDGVTAMSNFGVGSGTMVVASAVPEVTLVDYRASSYDSHAGGIPAEFTGPLPPGGAMPAPAGACPAAAKPESRFITEGGDVITPQLLAEKDIATLPVELINVSQNDPASLQSLIDSLVPRNDTRLGTPDGWNTLLWDRLKEMQVPAESLMDYQMWTLCGDLEQEVVASFRQSLAASGVPQRVLDAFDGSETSGWYAQNQPAPEDAIAMMDIQAVLTGSVEGAVHEWRDFSIPSLGADPVFGIQYGDGLVTMDLPGYGPADANVDIYLDQFDDQGRAVGGTVTAVPVEIDGYKIVFTYKPDGTKEGEVFDPDGNTVGYLTMAIDEEQFTNYVSIKEGTEMNLPLPAPTPSTTVFQ